MPVYDIARGVPQVKAVMTDGCTKPSHYSFAGKAHKMLQHTTTVNYDSSHDEIASATAAGRWAGSTAKASAAAGEASPCDSHIRCAQHSAPANGEDCNPH